MLRHDIGLDTLHLQYGYGCSIDYWGSIVDGPIDSTGHAVLGWLLQLHSGWPFYSDSVMA